MADRSRQRLSTLVLLPALWLPCAWVTSAPAPLPRAPKKPVQQPLAVVYETIQLGMPEEELLKVMAPFKKVYTGHGQWPCWTDGESRVYLTVWTDGDFLAGRGTWRVRDKALYRKQSGGRGTDWVPVKRAPPD